MKKIYLLAVGGTIAYVGGNKTDKSGGQLLKEANLNTESEIEIIARDVLRKGSAQLSMGDLFLIAGKAKEAIQEGADGIVITHGTDTLEETAFFLNLTVPHTSPLVITGAMKHGALLGADGSANVSAAITAAASRSLQKEGCVVVFDDKVLPSWYVRKTHTQFLETFQSQFGPIGYFSEGNLRMVVSVKTPARLENFEELSGKDRLPEVYIETAFAGNDGRMLKKAKESGYQGIVIEGAGGGHCSSEMAAAIEELGRDYPVIMSSRTGTGEVLNRTYSGGAGSEVRLLEKGVIYSGILDSRKSRILLILLLSKGYDVDKIRNVFANYSVFDD